MLLGDRAALDPADARVLRSSGLVHLLSISGLHVGLSLGLLLAVLGRTRLGPIATLVTLAGALAALVTLTGGQPPVARSALAAGVLLLGRALGRDGDPLNTLAVVAAALASADPFLLWSPSFQLTFAATAGLLAFARRCATSLPLPRFLYASLGVSTAAYLASTSILIGSWGAWRPRRSRRTSGGVLLSRPSRADCSRS
jgi:competence protein ComEC